MDWLIETYSLTEIAKKEKLYPTTIKKRYNYIPLKITTWQTRATHRAWISKKDYMVKYIKFDDVIKLLKDEIDFTFIRKKTK